MEEEETLESSGVIDSGKESISHNHSVKNRNYREIASNDSYEGTFPLKVSIMLSFFFPFLFLLTTLGIIYIFC